MDTGTDQERRFAAALAGARGRVSLLTDTDGSIVRVTPSVTELLGYRPEELLGTKVYDLYADPAHADYSRYYFLHGLDDLTATVADVGVLSRTARVRAADGSTVMVDSFPSPMRNDPEVAGVLIEWVPVSDRRYLTEAVDALALGLPPAESLPSVARLVESLFAQTEVAVLGAGPDGWTALVSPPGRTVAELLIALPPADHVDWARPWLPLEARFPVRRDAPGAGRTATAVSAYLLADDDPDDDRPLESAAVPLRVTQDGPLLGALLVIRPTVRPVSIFAAPAANLLQVAQRMAALALASERTHEELRSAAEHDPLTGLANRAGMVRQVSELTDRGVSEVTLAFVDLDDFKLVNDRHGHAAGDRMLCEVADRISRAVRVTDLVCRYGGDEFVVLIAGRLGVESQLRVQQALREAMEQPVTLPDGTVLPARASVGVSTGELHSIPELLRACDEQLYQDKRRRKASLVLAEAGPQPA